MKVRLLSPGFWRKFRDNARWIPAYVGQRRVRGASHGTPIHLIMALADHFEPSIVPNLPVNTYADHREQVRRVELWCNEYPLVVGNWRDADGRPFCHTYFYPAEQCDKEIIGRLAEHCHAGWGEIEIQLHHGVEVPATSASTRTKLIEFRETLAEHGCLSRLDGKGQPRYAFVHGNWALANSAQGRYCGVDDEMQILAETGCYADFTLPSAPDASQVSKINSLYECAIPLQERAPHRRGMDLECGRTPKIFPLIFQGPLMLDFSNPLCRWGLPVIENGELTPLNPATMRRLRLWIRAGISVRGRSDWIFIKLHCHGMDPDHKEAFLGDSMRRFLHDLVTEARDGRCYQVHFVTAREMVNIALAACDGREGEPDEFRDYRLRLATSTEGR